MSLRGRAGHAGGVGRRLEDVQGRAAFPVAARLEGAGMIAAGEKLLGALAGWRGYAAAAFAGAAVAWLPRAGATARRLPSSPSGRRTTPRPRRPWPQSRRPEPRRGGAQPPWRKPVMMQRKPRLRPLAAALALSLTGCAPALTRWLAPRSPEIPPLPTEARQGPQPSICSPTCSAGLATELKNLRALQTAPALQDWRANGRLMPSGKRRIQGGRRAITAKLGPFFGTSSPIRACVLR